jgi:hypothetical protein
MMRSMLRLIVVPVLLAILLPAVASGQGSVTSSIAGVVFDTNGGALPGATVVIKNNATGESQQYVTNEAGAFSAPSLSPGVYTVTVTLASFKTAVVSNVALIAGTPSNLPKITLELGQMSETVTVKANTELVQTQSASISSTLSANQINNLPVVTQNGSAFIANLPGVDTASGNHSIRSSTINGLPQSAINITLDGINDQDNSVKSTDGFWAMVHPKLDQVEEVTVTGAVPGADSSGQGAVTVKWVTRSGTNQFNGSAYEYFRHWDLNSNYYFNKVNGLPKNQIELNQFGFREGGPISKNQLFFFVNEEEFRRPASQTYTRNIVSPLGQSGIFQYTVNGVVQGVDLYALAARNGQTSTPDALVGSLLSRIRSATQSQGTVNPTADPNLQKYVYQGVGGRIEHNPTVKIDYNLSSSQHVSGTYNWQEAYQHPDLLNSNDPTFPGFANYADQTSYRNLGSFTLRSTLTPNVINEGVFGFLWSPIDFSGPLGPSQFADQGGFNLGVNANNANGLTTINGTTLTSGTISTSMSQRNASHYDFNDTLSWLRGNHNFQFGGTFTQINYWTDTQTAVPSIQFGVDATNDPAAAMFTAANLPGSSSSDRTTAQNLYALLTGRVVAINGNIRIDDSSGQYVYMGKGHQAGGMKETGLFAQDSWRVSHTLTFNLGLRWEVQMPFQAQNSVFSTATLASFCGVSGVGANGKCNMFQPGTLTGQTTTYQQYSAGTDGYHTDWNNLAPSLGVAWQPRVETGVLRAILGDPDQATIRGGYAIGYNRDGIGNFANVFAANPGLTVTQNRTAATGLLVPPGQTWPVLLRDTNRLGPPPFCSPTVTTLCMPQTPTYPIAASLSNSVNIFDPNFEVAHSGSATIGVQRALSSNMVVEVRYVGTRNHDGMLTQNLNEVVVVENGFANEFKLAQANLQANMSAGRGATFAYFGPSTGTSPLPIYLANLNGKGAALAGDPSQYTGANWTNTTMVSQLGLIQGGTPVSTAAGTLQSSATFRANMLAAGLPANFWVMNPDVSTANLTQSLSFTKYDSLQVDLRRAFTKGFIFTANYTLAKRYTSASDTLRQPLKLVLDTSGVKHALKLNGTWNLPFGRGRRLGTNMNGWLDALVGGWEVDGVARIQSGNVLDFGNVRLVGMSLDDLRKAFRIQFRNDPVTGLPTVYTLPQDIIDNTIRAFNVSAISSTGYAGTAPTGRYLAPANGPDCLQVVRGDCAPRDVFVTGPVFARVDFSARKTIPLGGRRSFQFEVDVLNLFNAIGFNAVAQASNTATINQVTSAYTDVSNTFDPGGRLGQLMFRFNF